MKVSAILGTVFCAAAATAQLSQAQAETIFRNAGISWRSSGGCSDRNRPTCTSFQGLRQATANGAVTLRNACGCAVTITGGTEVGHASGTYSHYNGYKLDFAKASGLNSYVTSAFTRIADRADGSPQYRARSGNIYADEGSHWDVTFYTDGS